MSHRYYVYDRIKRTVAYEFDAEDAKEATQMFDDAKLKDSTHFLFASVNTVRARRTQEEIDMDIATGKD